uniref:AlgX/AlgJ SGNH hydrolase-like domain-containing protein n=1 Tax=viral metagenome TaxID=1070528 RepID=A0A6C0LYW2_9ZZZZ
MHKTLKGKDNYLFLINDGNNSLITHTTNKFHQSDKNIIREKKNINNFYLLIYPDKEVICKKFLPNNIELKYRTSFDLHKTMLGDDLLDVTNLLEPTDYYKTDSHMNNKGNLKIYNYFIDFLEKKFPENKIEKKKFELNKVETPSLTSIGMGIGDLTWEYNKKNIILDDISDIYYKMPDEYNFYNKPYNYNEENFRILDKNLTDISIKYKNEFMGWDTVSNSIFYHKSKTPSVNKKVLVFYDSFLLHCIQLYKNLFNEIYFIKSTFNFNYLKIIEPDLVFEFRIERFL